MKNLLFVSIFLVIALTSFSQVKYDDGPIITGSNFVTEGTWGRNTITFSFQNGTNDIIDDDERNAIRQAFQIWADYGNLNFTEVNNNADIDILWGTGNHGDGFPFDGLNRVLAHAFFPPPNGVFAGDIHFDDDETWSMNMQATAVQPIDLVTVAAHEIGHALGLGHSNVACALMNPFYTGSHRYLSQDDIDGIQSIYGNRTVIRNINSNCSGGTYFINNLPTGASVTWSSSNTAIATVVNNNNQGIVSWTGNLSGMVRITATILLPCGQNVIEFFDMNYGLPDTDLVNFTNGASGEGFFCTSHYGNQFEPILSFNPDNVGVEYRLLSWPNLNIVYTDPTIYALGSITVGSNFAPGWYVLEYRIITDCGTSAWSGFEVEFVDCSQIVSNQYFSIQASPNPASSDLYVSTSNEKPAVKALKASEKVSFILYDFNRGQPAKQWTFLNNLKQYKINVAGIKPGQYVLMVTKGKYRQSTQIIIR